MKNKFGSLYKYLFIVLGLDILLAFSVGYDTSDKTDIISQFVPFIGLGTIASYIYTYYTIKRYIVAKFFLFNMYGATFIYVEDLAKNTGQNKHRLLDKIKQIIQRNIISDMFYDEQNNALQLKTNESSEQRYFNIRVKRAKMKSGFFWVFALNFFCAGTLWRSFQQNEYAILLIASVIVLYTLIYLGVEIDIYRIAILMKGKTKLSLSIMREAINKYMSLGAHKKYIKRLISSNDLPNLTISADGEYLTYEQNIMSQYNKYASQVTSVHPAPTHIESQPEQIEAVTRGRDYIHQIRKINQALPDKEISEKLDKLEHVTKQIFNFIEKNPTKSDSVRKLLDYHLPTTLKLVNTYKDMASIGTETANIEHTKQEIYKIFDIVIPAFENILDKLVENIRLNVSSEISVLKTILEQDGLTDNDPFGIRKNKGE